MKTTNHGFLTTEVTEAQIFCYSLCLCDLCGKNKLDELS